MDFSKKRQNVAHPSKGFFCIRNNKKNCKSNLVYIDTILAQDGFKLRLGISKADPLQKERIELLSKLYLPSVGEFPLKPGTEPISNTLLAFLRVFSMRKAELTHWLRSDKVSDLKHMDCALETVVEENVRKFLLTRLQLLIANYPTTLKVNCGNSICSIVAPIVVLFSVNMRNLY